MTSRTVLRPALHFRGRAAAVSASAAGLPVARVLRGIAAAAATATMLGVPVIAAGTTPAASQTRCDAIADAAREMQGAGEVARWRELFEMLRDGGRCGAGLDEAVRLGLATALSARAERRLRTGDDRDAVEHDLREALVYHADWRLFERLGDVASQDGDYAEASIRYMYAIHTIATERDTPDPPASERVVAVLEKFSTVWSIADINERPLPNIIGGMQSRTWHKRLAWRAALGFEPLRGVVPDRPLLAVTFGFAGPVITRQGGETLVIVLALLEEIGSPDLRLTGHAGADERGEAGETDLDALALARAEAVRDWFEARNYGGAVYVHQAQTVAGRTQVDGLDLPERVEAWFARRVDYRWD